MTDKSESDYPGRVRAAVRQALAEHHWSARAMAHRLGWTQSYLAHRLTGRAAISIDDLVAIAGVLDVSPDELLPAPERVAS